MDSREVEPNVSLIAYSGRNGHRFRLQMATDSGEWPLIPGNGHPQAFPSKRFLFTIIEALGAIQRLRQWPKSTKWPFCGMGGHFQRNTQLMIGEQEGYLTISAGAMQMVNTHEQSREGKAAILVGRSELNAELFAPHPGRGWLPTDPAQNLNFETLHAGAQPVAEEKASTSGIVGTRLSFHRALEHGAWVRDQVREESNLSLGKGRCVAMCGGRKQPEGLTAIRERAKRQHAHLQRAS